jgi:hypothetical protein
MSRRPQQDPFLLQAHQPLPFTFPRTSALTGLVSQLTPCSYTADESDVTTTRNGIRWRKEGSVKQPYYVTLNERNEPSPHDDAMAFAGLYDCWYGAHLHISLIASWASCSDGYGSDGRQEGARRQRAVDVQHAHHGTVRQVRPWNPS